MTSQKRIPYQEVKRIIIDCRTPRTQALIAYQYAFGCRAGELAKEYRHEFTNDAGGKIVSDGPRAQDVKRQTSGKMDLNQIIYNPNGVTYTVSSKVYRANTLLNTLNYTGSATTTLFWHDINRALLYGKVVVNLRFTKDGNSWDINKTYNFGNWYDNNTITYDPIQDGLRTGVRQNLGCGPEGPCAPTIFISLIVIAGLIAWISLMLGAFNRQATAAIGVVCAVAFTYLNWIPLELLAAIIIIVAAFLLHENG